uniref:Uncharacterized protein n=1 Tax=Rhizophora mucronata TaxID=61149 RepID=A0A2P2R3E4_RHIMU
MIVLSACIRLIVRC